MQDHPEFLHQALSLAETENFKQIESVVVCRGFEHTGFMNKGNVPIIMEVAFSALVKASTDFRDLWSKLTARPDRQEAAKKMVDVLKTVRVGSYEFVLPCLGRL